MSTIVEVKQGFLEGRTQKSILTGKEYFCYLGVPYAKPPVGDLRFQPPQPIEKWDGVWNAREENSPCMQKGIPGGIVGSEDCLYLNVCTPEKPNKNGPLRAVMVFIHGGGFYSGSGSLETYSPDYLMNYDVILVTINYRLHVLGFLDMGTKNCAGNCGLRDQNLAIKWVKENISQFGGDPENITVFGASAGAGSVYCQMLSPMSKGLFQKAIVQSDVCSSLYGARPEVSEIGFKFGQDLGFHEKDPEKLVEFLKKLPAEEITKKATSLLYDSGKSIMECLHELFMPAPEINKENAFFPDTFQNLKKMAVPIPLMTGCDTKEGRLIFMNVNKIENLKKDFKPLPAFDSHQGQNICDKIRKRYLGDELVGEETIDKITDLYTGYYVKDFYDNLDFIDASKTPIYIYEFSFFGKFNVLDRFITKNVPPLKSGAGHGDELPYLFYPKKFLPNLTEFPEPEITVIKNMCSMWTDFAKSTNPTANLKGIEWRPFTSEKPCYLSINNELKLVEKKLRGEEFEFWKTLLE